MALFIVKKEGLAIIAGCIQLARPGQVVATGHASARAFSVLQSACVKPHSYMHVIVYYIILVALAAVVMSRFKLFASAIETFQLYIQRHSISNNIATSRAAEYNYYYSILTIFKYTTIMYNVMLVMFNIGSHIILC